MLKNTLIRNIAYAAITAAVLSACSSGGGSEAAPSALTPSVPDKPAATNTDQPAQNNPAKSPAGNQGFAANKEVAVSGDHKSSVITVDGHQIAVTHPFIISGRFTSINDSKAHTVASGTKFNHIRFGGQIDKVNGNTPYVFAVGDVTKDVPASGKASYVGDSVVINSNGLTDGAAKFDVDFGAKNITGSASGVALAGKINGAAFEGTKDGVAMQGNFYGPAAAELSGVFKGDNVQGAFGAKKQ
ncbi:transferrin-binding protein-like solute binding protein [Neisseria lisongii]|uniref:Transferrin-binding protein-like solute binding protein n=1 Tax=Neisseria lisongii TaxID=2912188 RepID=A0AAW5ANP9_9NEIS|nr:transferrin-binding protein-like solute binding protein [Neisseria lisongii]MCF7529787.1 transferrin-binding protein-like solute binding protein [Neisseria lisongii]